MHTMSSYKWLCKEYLLYVYIYVNMYIFVSHLLLVDMDAACIPFKKTHPLVKTKRSREVMLFCLSEHTLIGTSFYRHWWLWFQNSWHKEGNLIDYPTKPPFKVTSQEFFIPSSYFCWEKVLVFTSKKGWNVQPPKNIDPNGFLLNAFSGVVLCLSAALKPHTIHWTGISTYMNGWFVWWISR